MMNRREFLLAAGMGLGAVGVPREWLAGNEREMRAELLVEEGLVWNERLALSDVVGGEKFNDPLFVFHQEDHSEERLDPPMVEVVKKGLAISKYEAQETPVQIKRLTTPNFRQWYELHTPPEELVFNNVAFEVANVERELWVMDSGEDFYAFFGYVSNFTGDPSRWRAYLGGFYPERPFDFLPQFKNARTGREQIEINAREASYGIVAQRTIYDNKIYNMLKALDDFRHNTQGGLFPGAYMSYIDSIGIAKHFDEAGHEIDKYYLPGFVVGGEIWPAGGACATVTTTGKAAYRAAREGWLEISKSQAHSQSPYFVNREDTDTIDATAAYLTSRSRVDLVLRNICNEVLYFVPRADIWFPEVEEGKTLPIALEKPATAKLAVSMTITDRRPTLEDSESVKVAYDKFVAYRKKYGGPDSPGVFKDGFFIRR